MIKATITLTLTGGVRLLREAKSLSNQDIQNALQNANNDPAFGKVFAHLPSTQKNHDVTIEEIPCTQRINIMNVQFKEIMSGQARPSDSFCLNNKLMIIKKKDGRRVKEFMYEKWRSFSEEKRLALFFNEVALDRNAELGNIEILK